MNIYWYIHWTTWLTAYPPKKLKMVILEGRIESCSLQTDSSPLCLYTSCPYLEPTFDVSNLWRNTLSLPLATIQFTSGAQSFRTLCNPMNRSTPGLPAHHQLPESTQTNIHWVGDAIQPSHPLSSPSPPALNLSQHQGLFKWVSSSHQVAKVLEFQLQHQSFQWTPRTDLP